MRGVTLEIVKNALVRIVHVEIVTVKLYLNGIKNHANFSNFILILALFFKRVI